MTFFCFLLTEMKARRARMYIFTYFDVINNNGNE